MYDNLNFTITNLEGKTITCNILSILPADNNNFYVVFEDGEKGEDNIPIFKYGKMIENNGEYELKNGISESELEEIKKNFAEEVQELVDKYQESES